MSRGILEPPNLDDRSWQDIVDETRALIPSYAPDWTDHNPGDLGITLIELFAWMTEGMIYRINRIPEKHFIEFLNLLGITRDPATPANSLISFSLAPNALPTLIPAGTRVATAQTGTEESIVFETDFAITAAATNLVEALFIVKVFGNKYRRVSTEIVAPPLTGSQQTIPAGGSVMLPIGFDSATADTIPLHIRMTNPVEVGSVDIEWLYSQGALGPTDWPVFAGVTDGTEDLSTNGDVELNVPLDWTAQNPTADWPTAVPDSLKDEVDRALFWVGLRISNLSADPLTIEIDGIYCNAASATSALTIDVPEVLATSDGSAFQTYELAHAPLYQIPSSITPWSHLTIEIREPLPGNVFGPWTQWSLVDEILEGPGNVFKLDAVRAMVFFGNHDSTTGIGFGSIPAKDAQIRATSYRYTAGDASANVPAGTISVVRTPVTGLIGAINPGPAYGGSNEESIDSAKRRAPELLRNRNRAVTDEDFDYLAVESTTDIGKIKTLGPRLFSPYDTKPPGVLDGDPWTYGGLLRTPGSTYVIVVPNTPNDPRPTPTVELISQTSDYLAARRPINSVMQVVGPRYLPIRVLATIRIWQQAIDSGLVTNPLVSNEFRDNIVTSATQFLHPLTGNHDGNGFDIGAQLMVSELFAYLAPPDDIGYIESIEIEAQTPLYDPPDRPFAVGIPSVSIVLTDYELVCSADNHSVTVLAV